MLHGGDAGDSFSLRDGPLNRCRAPILGQKRCVHVQVAELRQMDHPRWNDATIADDDDCVGLERGEFSLKLGIVFDLVGLGHGNAEFDRAFFHGGGRELHASPARPVRLRDHKAHVKPGVDQFLQGRDGKARGSGKDEVHVGR